MKSQFFPNRVVWRLGLAIGLSREFKPRANGLASLGLLSYSATALQLPACSTRVPTLAACQSQSLASTAMSLCILAQSLAFLHTFSLTILTWIPLNTGLLIAKIQANLAWNKANKMVDKIQPYKTMIKHLWRVVSFLSTLSYLVLVSGFKDQHLVYKSEIFSVLLLETS